MKALYHLRKSSCVEIIDDERAIGNGFIVTLRRGWTFDPLTDNRVAGADNITDLRQLIGRAQSFKGPYTK